MTITLSLVQQDKVTKGALYDISCSVAHARKIVVVTGAGISCSSGIPDFRSADGLYNLVKEQYPDTFMRGRDLFDAALFRDPSSTSIFYSFISKLKTSIDAASPTKTHHFIKTLDSKKKLLRSYTQNIDGLEERAGLSGSSSQRAKGKEKLVAKDVRNVQLHGDIHRVRCLACSAEFPCTEEHLRVFNEGQAPDCPECHSRSEARVARSARPLRVGTLRPAIVLYDEPHPLGDDIGTIQSADVSRKPDLLIIMGTSLKVHGLKKLVREFAKVVHASPSSSKKQRAGKVVFVNRTPPSAEWASVIDYHVEGETDVWVEKVLADWKRIRPSDWQTQTTLDANGTFQIVKGKSIKLGGNSKKKKAPTSENKKQTVDVVTRPSSPADPSAMLISPLAPFPPPSPSKRRRAPSSYDVVGSSPTKKQSMDDAKWSIERPDIPPLQLPLLGDSTNQRMELDEGPEIIDKPIKSSKGKGAMTKREAEAGSSSLRRTRSQTRLATDRILTRKTSMIK